MAESVLYLPSPSVRGGGFNRSDCFDNFYICHACCWWRNLFLLHSVRFVACRGCIWRMGGCIGVWNFNHFSKTKQGTPRRGRLSNRFWNCVSRDCSEKFRFDSMVWILKPRLSELQPDWYTTAETKGERAFAIYELGYYRISYELKQRAVSDYVLKFHMTPVPGKTGFGDNDDIIYLLTD